VRYSVQTILVLSLVCGLPGCFGPDYGPSYGYPTSGYSPYSYGLPVYTSGYAPNFVVHHPWEEHHTVGHPGNFFHERAVAPHSVGGHVGGFGGHIGGGHGGGHR
jgi:hypothetical protein